MGRRLKSLESEMQQVEGEYQSALCPRCPSGRGPCL